MSKSTGLISNLAALYRSYGGLGALVRSAYFWLSAAVSLLCWRYVASEEWAGLSRDILPQLAGFSVAAYALFFAVLDERSRDALKAPSEKLGGRSPLLILASSISHAVIVQVIAVIFGLIYSAKPFPACDERTTYLINMTAGALGLFLLIYGVLLVLAAVLSIFRILEIESRI